jgi:hypothetical protein
MRGVRHGDEAHCQGRRIGDRRGLALRTGECRRVCPGSTLHWAAQGGALDGAFRGLWASQAPCPHTAPAAPSPALAMITVMAGSISTRSGRSPARRAALSARARSRVGLALVLGRPRHRRQGSVERARIRRLARIANARNPPSPRRYSHPLPIGGLPTQRSSQTLPCSFQRG